MGQLHRLADAWPLDYAHARASRSDLGDEGCGTHGHLSRRPVVGVQRIERQREIYVAETQAVWRANDARLARTERNAADRAHASSFAIDDHPVLSSRLEANARSANAGMIDDGIA